MSDVSLLISMALKHVMKGICDGARTGIKQKIARYSTDKFINTLHQKISDIEYVKTLYGRDEKQRLRDFYFPARIDVNGHRMVVENVDGILGEGICVLEGTAGQGKSILARYLCIKELERGMYVPIFVELRKYKGDSFDEFIFDSLKDLGFKEINPEIFEWLVDSGRVVLILDGFDEVSKELRESVVTGIERLKYRKNLERIIVTSRPHSGIEGSGHVVVRKVSPLTNTEITQFIETLVRDIELSSFLISTLSKNPSVQMILTTPLMVTLLCVTYRISENIPRTMPEFYEKLFETLASAHDRNKQGFERYRDSGFTDWEMQKIFEHLSFISLKNSRTRMTKRELCTFSEKAIVGKGKDDGLTQGKRMKPVKQNNSL